jgi:hypothetical protein
MPLNLILEKILGTRWKIRINSINIEGDSTLATEPAA